MSISRHYAAAFGGHSKASSAELGFPSEGDVPTQFAPLADLDPMSGQAQLSPIGQANAVENAMTAGYANPLMAPSFVRNSTIGGGLMGGGIGAGVGTLGALGLGKLRGRMPGALGVIGAGLGVGGLGGAAGAYGGNRMATGFQARLANDTINAFGADQMNRAAGGEYFAFDPDGIGGGM
jgi:hypothetical protein